MQFNHPAASSEKYWEALGFIFSYAFSTLILFGALSLTGKLYPAAPYAIGITLAITLMGWLFGRLLR